MCIRCDVCDRLVDRVTRERSMERDVVRFTVHCHGDTDTCELTETQLMEMTDLRPGRAFVTRRIEDG